MLNKLIKPLLLIGACLGVVFCVLAADIPRTLRVGIYNNPPKVYQEDGVAIGLFPDILKYIASQEHWQLEYVFGTWEEGLARLERGDINIMVDVALSEERLQKFDFANETIFNSWGEVFVRRNSSIDSFSKLNGKKIAILESSVYFGGPEGVDTYMHSFGFDAEFIPVPEQADVLEKVSQGEVDAGIVSRVFALTNQGRYPNLQKTDIFFSPTELRFAFTRGAADNQYFIEQLDFWVKKLKGGYEGVYQKILERYGLVEGGANTGGIHWWVYVIVGTGILIASWPVFAWLKRKGIIKRTKKS